MPRSPSPVAEEGDCGSGSDQPTADGDTDGEGGSGPSYERGGPRDNRTYEYEVMRRSLTISDMMKRDSDQKNMLLECLEMMDSEKHSTKELQAAIISGEVRVPTRSTMRLGRFKFDVLNMHWIAELYKTYAIIRYAVPDSSPQGNYNYFCCREDMVMFPLTCDKVDIIMNHLHEYWISRSMVCTTLGAGTAK